MTYAFARHLDLDDVAHLLATKADDPKAAIDWLARECEAGEAGVYGVHVGEDRRVVAAFAIRVEDTGDGLECVVMASGAEPGHSLTAPVLDFCEAEAKARGCGSIRFHTSRRAFERIAPTLGWHEAEVVYRKELI